MDAPSKHLTILAGLLCAAVTHGQVLVNGTGTSSAVRVFPSDMAVFEAGEERKDLPCSVVGSKALLGFDLRYHAGYEVSVPLKELSGSENLLTML